MRVVRGHQRLLGVACTLGLAVGVLSGCGNATDVQDSAGMLKPDGSVVVGMAGLDGIGGNFAYNVAIKVYERGSNGKDVPAAIKATGATLGTIVSGSNVDSFRVPRDTSGVSTSWSTAFVVLPNPKANPPIKGVVYENGKRAYEKTLY